jgi:hypothetical protein
MTKSLIAVRHNWLAHYPAAMCPNSCSTTQANSGATNSMLSSAAAAPLDQVPKEEQDQGDVNLDRGLAQAAKW